MFYYLLLYIPYMKILKTEIWIDKNNNWWVNHNPIVNEGVLKLFKMNLHFDGDYFIYLSSRTTVEKGYLKSIEGFPLLCIDVEFKEDLPVLKLDNNKTVKLSKIYYDVNKNAFWYVLHDTEYQTYLPFILPSNTIQMIQSLFTEDDKRQYLLYKDQHIPILYKFYDPYNTMDSG